MREKHQRNALHSRIVVALLAIHVVLAVGSMRHTSLIWDEPAYIGIGRQLLETGNPEIRAIQPHPPLSYYVNSLLLLPLEFEPDRFDDERYLYHEDIGPPLIFDSGYSPGLITFLARIPFVVLSVVLGILVYRWAKEIYGAGAAVISTFFYALCPLILAHCRLATNDLLLSLNMSLALFLFYRSLRDGSIKSEVLAGLAAGLAILSKFTGLILIPTFLFLVSWNWFKTRAAPSRPARRLALGLALIFGTAALVIWAGYGFQVVTPFVPRWLEPQAQRLIAEKPFWQAVDWAAGRGIRVPAFSFILGIYTQLASVRGWSNNFLFGRISQEGWWYFQWAAFFIKTPLPLLVCAGAALAARRNRDGRKQGESFLLLSMLPLILIFSLPTGKNIGIRFILPLYPLLCVLAGKAATLGSSKWKWTLVFLCAWYAGSALWIYPNYLAYFNELVGGPAKGYRYLVDSNLDWGQKLHDLEDYLKKNDIASAKIKYFGHPGAIGYYDLEFADPNECEPSPGIWAVSATYLQNLYLDDRHCHDWLRELEPTKVIGYSIFIYDVSEEQAAAQAR